MCLQIRPSLLLPLLAVRSIYIAHAYGKTIRSFWNRAAEQNPHSYVSSYGSYDADRNLDEFWASGHAIARQANLPNVDFRVAQGFALPGIQDKWVDLSLGYCVFQHLPSRTALKSYLSEMHRVTKAGGMVAFTLTPRDWRTWLLPLCALELTCENAYRAKAQKVSTGKNG